MRNTYLLTAAFFCTFLGFATAQQYLTVALLNTGHPDLALISLFLLYGTFLLSGFFVSRMIPFFGGLKRSLMLGTFTYALFVASVASGLPALILISAAIMGAGASLLWVASAQLITDSSTDRSSGRNLGLQLVGQSLGGILGLYAAFVLLPLLTVSGFYIVLTISVLASFVFLIGIRPVREEVQERPFRPLYAMDRKMLLLAPLLFGASYLATQSFTAMNDTIVALFGVGFIATVMLLYRVSNIVGSLSMGAAAGVYPKHGLLVGIVIAMLLGSVLFTHSASVWVLALGALLIGFAVTAVPPVCIAWIKASVSDDEYLQALGAVHIYANAGAITAIVANLILSANHSFIPGVIALVGAIPCIFLFNARARRRILSS